MGELHSPGYNQRFKEALEVVVKSRSVVNMMAWNHWRERPTLFLHFKCFDPLQRKFLRFTPLISTSPNSHKKARLWSP